MTELSSATRDALLRVGTSTLTGILSRRGLRNMFLQDVWPIRPDMPRMVGPAFTMRFIPAREDKTATGRGPVQQRAMEECPPGHVLVVDAVAEEAVATTLYDEFAEQEVARGRSLIGLFPAAGEDAKRDFEEWKKKRSGT